VRGRRHLSLWWVRSHQPKDGRGKFAKGWLMWTREWLDGEMRWIFYPEPEPYRGWEGPR
jgi:hypothetical protein